MKLLSSVSFPAMELYNTKEMRREMYREHDIDGTPFFLRQDKIKMDKQ